jgi:hypothetical protein
MDNEASVYWIRLPEHNDIYTQGYVGVSKNWNGRLTYHLNESVKGTHPNNHLMYAINKTGWDNLIKEEVLAGEEDFCYEFEATLRPDKKIGWNIAPGGHRGPGWVAGRKKSKKSTAKQIATKAKNRAKFFEENKERLEEEERIRVEKHLADKEARRAEREKQRKLAREAKRLAERLAAEAAREAGLLSSLLLGAPICIECNTAPARKNGISKKDGRQLYQKMCNTCAKNTYVKSQKSDTCEECGFVCSHMCQMCLVDGNKTLCANCNALRLRENKVIYR